MLVIKEIGRYTGVEKSCWLHLRIFKSFIAMNSKYCVNFLEACKKINKKNVVNCVVFRTEERMCEDENGGR